MNKKPKAILTQGLIASGKTSWCKQFLKNNNNYVRLSRDDCRTMLDNYSYSLSTEKIVTELINNAMMYLITQKCNFIIDEQHLNEKYLNEKILILKNNNYDIEIQKFPITLGEAIIRDSKRLLPIGEKVIKSVYKKYEIKCKELLEEFKPKYPWNGDLPYCVICDIDGTLAHSPNRRIFDFKEVINDELIIPVWSILDKYKTVCDIILLSGRGGDCRKETEEWLLAKHVPYTHLYMRKEKDNRSDVIIKTELFDAYIRDKYQPIFVIDDRPVVLQMWQDMGIFTLNVNQDVYAKNNF